MHPILASARRAALYCGAWGAIAALLVYAMWDAGGIAWQDAARGLGPACLIEAFLCLTPWYLCRIRPMRQVDRALPPAIVVAVVAGGVFVVIARLAASVLAAQTLVLFGLGSLLYLLSTGLHYAAVASMEQREAEQSAAEARSLARESQLQALKFQLNPHFLFNSLHSIAALATQDGIRAREMCIRLSDFLRAGLGLGERESIPLREELALARSYLAVERVRFGERLKVEESIAAESEDCLVPALILQPLIENAVKHGVAGLLDGGAIRLSARRSGAGVTIDIENEYDAEDMEAERASATPVRAGIGLAHVKRRLAVRYGDDASFDAQAGNAIYRVSLRLPCESTAAGLTS
jgi:two-component system, LytTR family, sensor histidine kinase AlgZ